MTEHGHPLRFGVFITPSAADADRVVDLAVQADRAGLDLVTFQDHPYQSRFLDTWTLLSFVAARTERVTISANVLNLPLRPPAVVARAVASLDILSGGRAELGLGAGAFWDAIAAMGGPRRAPGESVVALEEAIDVIRALWDADAGRGARLDGDHYGLAGAARGPAPVHDVGDLAGRLQAADARPGGPQGRRLAAEPVVPAARRPGRRQRPDRPGGPFGGGATPRTIRRLLNVGADLTPRGPRPPRPRGPHRHPHRDGRRPRRDRAPGRRGRAGGARAGGGGPRRRIRAPPRPPPRRRTGPRRRRRARPSTSASASRRPPTTGTAGRRGRPGTRGRARTGRPPARR